MNLLPPRLQTYFYSHKWRAILVLMATLAISIFTTWQIVHAVINGIGTKPVVVTPKITNQSGGGGEIIDIDGPTQWGSEPLTSQQLLGGPKSSTSGTTSSPDTNDNRTSSGGGSSSSSSSSIVNNQTGISISIPGIDTTLSLRTIVPQFGSVLTLTGLNYNVTNYMPDTFEGIFNRPPYTLAKINYPASLDSDSISKGVSALNDAVRSTPGQKIVLAHSQGAQVVSHWLRQYANDPTAPSASELSFVLLGNPLRATGGYIIGRTEVGGTIGQATPTNTKWPIIDIARRYDGWADPPNDTSNQWAVKNSTAGKSSVHPHYENVNIYDSTNTVWKSGNTTFVLTKEDTLPLWSDNSKYPLGVRAAMRAYIETAYNRPTNDSKTILLPIESASWEKQLQTWGVPY